MRTTLAGDFAAPGEARAFVSTQLGDADLPHDVPLGNVLLVVSELVTNAVQAGATVVEVDLVMVPQRLELVVNDDADGWPSLRNAGRNDERGRGLTIVSHLSDTWSVTSDTRGKRVTATWSAAGS